MKPNPTTLESLESPRRSDRFLLGSLLLHAMLFLLAFLAPRGEMERVRLTEITFLEPGEAEASAALPSGSPSSRSTPAAAPSTPTAREERRFERIRLEAEISPQPQSPEVIGDQLSARLSSIQRLAATRLSQSDATEVPPPSWGPAGGGVTPSLGSSGGAVALNRGGAGRASSGPKGVELRRGAGTSALSPATLATGIPSPDSRGPAPAKVDGVQARKQLAGATLMGPIADRPIVRMTRPSYPDWAKREAVEASVTLYFVVRPDGSVGEGVVIQKTAGFQDFDESARRAIRAWRFQTLTSGQTGDQWGTVTFHFRLKDAG